MIKMMCVIMNDFNSQLKFRPFKCKICGTSRYNNIIKREEMNFGLPGMFYYYECAECGSLNLSNIPKDLSRYYPREYMSKHERYKNLKLFASAIIYKIYVNGKTEQNLIKKIVEKLRGSYTMFSLIDVLLNLSHKTSFKGTSLLDVGANDGKFLKKIRLLDFKKLIGIDPFMDGSKGFGKKIKLLKKDIFNLNDKFDYVILNHSIEHVKNPIKVMKKLREIIKDDGIVLIRTPLADSYAFKKYKQDWCHLDAPRHILIFTHKSMKISAKKSGFKIKKIIYDATEDTFRFSELYKRNLLLSKNENYFDKKYILEWTKLANKLNSEGGSDSAAFFLKPI